MTIKTKKNYKYFLIITFTLTFFLGQKMTVNAFSYGQENGILAQNGCEYSDAINGKRYSTSSCDYYNITACQPTTCDNAMCIYSSKNGSSISGVISRNTLANSAKAGCDESGTEDPNNPGNNENPTEDPVPDEEKTAKTFYNATGDAITIAIGEETNNIYLQQSDGTYKNINKYAKFDSTTNVTAANFGQFTYMYHAGSATTGAFILGKSCDIKTNQYAKTANYASNKSDAIACKSAEDFDLSLDDVTKACESLLGDPADSSSIAYWIQWCLDILKYAAIVLLLGLSTTEFVQALVKDDKDALKKALIKTLKRFVFAVLIFFLPIIVEVIMKVFGAYGTCGIG